MRITDLAFLRRSWRLQRSDQMFWQQRKAAASKHAPEHAGLLLQPLSTTSAGGFGRQRKEETTVGVYSLVFSVQTQ